MSWLQSIRHWLTRTNPSTRRVNTFRPSLEGLEHRLVPANVTASVSAGVLTLTSKVGNFEDHITVTADSTPGRFHLVGAGTTINGVTDFLAKGFTSVVFDLKGGNDTVIIKTNFPGDLSFNAGDGENQFEIDNCFIGGSVRYVGGASAVGIDNLTISGAATKIGRDVKAAFGEGTGFLTLAGAFIGGSVGVKGGAGVDEIRTEGVTIAGSLAAKLGNGANTVTIEAANDGISGSGATFIGGALTIAGGAGIDKIELGSESGVQILGKVSLATGDEMTGGDTVQIDNTDFYSAFLLNLGAGNNLFSLETVDILNQSTVFHSAATVLGGAGMDTIAVGQATGARFAEFGYPPTLDGGAGTDTLFLINLFVEDVDVDSVAKLGKAPLNLENVIVS